ncbi:peptidoglycan recognition protein family protein [Acinetobacter boissieri]|uniref:N-acetylmuramoyl-L-alanine amidase n=1 Tax=Acinetobacter boissieri TaxID=1219383 RepID=A0A1G6HJC0_9GAMM|nr:peptidoglycan recognition family protein [Acinetobacter boissieri]SDB94198.1 N-acetylmuramoyl-L-alanine amidase [Acinetobacter boissieri]
MKDSRFTTTVRASSGQCEPTEVQVDDRAATRSAILNFIKKQQVHVVESSEWGAKPPQKVNKEWMYKSIALHHAGNSFACNTDARELLKKVEEIDRKTFHQLTYHYAIACDGTVYELLDIRWKGSHIDNGNTKVIGIVMLEDLSHSGEAYVQEYKNKSFRQKIRNLKGLIFDQFDTSYDTVSQPQEKALTALLSALTKYFAIDILGGHREFQVLANKEGRACPGAEGMKLVKNMRKTFSFVAPSKSNYPHK